MAFPTNGITFSNPNGIYLGALPEGLSSGSLGMPMLSQPQGFAANPMTFGAGGAGGSSAFGANAQVQSLLASLSGQANPLANLAAAQMGINFTPSPMSQQLGLQGAGLQSLGAYGLNRTPAPAPAVPSVVPNYLAALQNSIQLNTTGLPPQPTPSGSNFGFGGTGFTTGGNSVPQGVNVPSHGGKGQPQTNFVRNERSAQVGGHGGGYSGGGGGKGGFGG
eukprot:EG_transcript_29498